MNRKLLWVYSMLLGGFAALAPLIARAQTSGDQSPGGAVGDIFSSSNEVLFALIAPAAIPWLIAAVVQDHWSAIVKQITTFIVCAIAALGYLLYQDEKVLSWDGLPRLAIIIAVVAYGYYRIWNKPVKEVEATTTLNRGGGA